MAVFGIVGGGGFGREVIPVAHGALKKKYSNFELVFVEKNPVEKLVNGFRVLDEEDFFSLKSEKFFNVAIADHVLRRKIVELYINKKIDSFSINSCDSLSLSSNDIGEGAIICPFSMITSNAKIGNYFHCNIYSYVAHDCVIGDYVTFAPSVRCNGNVIIEDGAYIGTGAIIKNGTAENPIVIGRNAVVGMGAVVTKSVQPETTVIGNPAKIFDRK